MSDCAQPRRVEGTSPRWPRGGPSWRGPTHFAALALLADGWQNPLHPVAHEPLGGKVTPTHGFGQAALYRGGAARFC